MREQDLIAKLRRISALFDGATTIGEKRAADAARKRVESRLEQQRRETQQTYKFTMGSTYTRRLFVAVVRKHGLKPYRRYRQRHTTVMVDVTPGFLDDVLWPEFEQLSESLQDFLDDITDRVIREAVHSDQSDAEVVAELGMS